MASIETTTVQTDGVDYRHWEGPHIVAAGWESSSAGLGVPGNTVIYGWQDVYGAPFKDVHKLLKWQVIQLKSGSEIFNYRIVFTAILDGPCQDMRVGSESERWVLPSLDERVTLITCYPETAYTHRVVVVALREP
ncbi:MAG: sortase [Anaerolineales bacterium]